MKRHLLFLLLFISSFAYAQKEMPRSNFDFMESIGICTHFSYNSQPYVQRFDTLSQLLGDLGIRYIRDRAVADTDLGRKNIMHLYDTYGIKTIAVFPWHKPFKSFEEVSEKIDGLAPYLDAIVAIEGANENDAQAKGPNEPANWADDTQKHQKFLFNKIKQHPNQRIANMPVIAPSPTFPNRVVWMGPMTDKSDHYNIHSYHGTNKPEAEDSNLRKYMVKVNEANPNDPHANQNVWATEAGYHNEIGYVAKNPNGIHEQSEAYYLPRLLCHYFNFGIKRTYIYELVDHADHNPNGGQDDFGIVRYDMSKTPTYLALQNMIKILDEKEQTNALTALDYSIDGADGDTYHTLLQKKDGTHYLLIWNAGTNYDFDSRSFVEGKHKKISIQFNGKSKDINLYNPLVSDQPSDTKTQSKSYKLTLKDHIQILEIKPSEVNL
ncbi:hypothetical protein [Persicobacter diffluens]